MAKGSITELRLGVYRIRVDAGNDPVTGKRIQASRVMHGGKREAQSALNELIHDIDSKRIQVNRTKISEILDEWIDLKKSSLSPKTIDIYQHRSEKILKPALGNRQVKELTSRDLDKLYQALEAKGTSSYVIHQVHSTIRAALTQAQKWGLVTNNVALHASLPSLPKTKERSIAVEELSSCIDLTREIYGPGLTNFFLLAALTGARRGELLGIRREDVDFGNSRLSISRSVIQTRAGTIEKSTKTRQERAISLDPEALGVIEDQLSDLMARAQDGLFELCSNPYIFAVDPTGRTPYSPDWPTHAFRKVMDQLNFPYHLHELRHFSATQLIAAGVDIKTVSSRLGHADPSMTLRVYSHAVRERDVEAARILGSIVHRGH
ncbi:MAG: tyrosine-type recombinase/integrase [Ferrimicrobium sp.]